MQSFPPRVCSRVIAFARALYNRRAISPHQSFVALTIRLLCTVNYYMFMLCSNMASGVMQLGYVILYVPDVRTAMAFYKDAIALSERFMTDGGDYGEMETGQTKLAFASEELASSHRFDFERRGPDANPAAFEIALVTEDVEAAFDGRWRVAQSRWQNQNTCPGGSGSVTLPISTATPSRSAHRS